MAPMIPLPPVNSLDVTMALTRVGFEIATLTPERVVLRRGGRTLVLERHKIIEEAELSLLLRMARISPFEFLELHAPHMSGTQRRVRLEDLQRADALPDSETGTDPTAR